ncbi:glycosyl transferase [Aphanothece sacrum FPU1]|uniref:Glycosyl transferase n=2 Tax=Aphanothece sacrum TaxID=1122 RepID=A0A401IJL1_APHSA|nr:glycosyl transferase [Aphanothece sacrum FPU1]
MDIAVIIPLFNGAKWIRQTLESVFSQSHLPREVVVVDDGSTDKSLEILQDFPHVKLLRSPDKGGPAARNFGLQQTTAPLVAFLDQDDIWHPDHLRLLSGLLCQYPQYPAAVAMMLSFEDNLVFPHPVLDEYPLDFWSTFPRNSIGGPSPILIRRTALDSIGGWPTKFSTSAFYAWLRLSANHPFMQNRSFTVGYRQHDQSHSYRLRKQCSFYDEQIEALEDALPYRIMAQPQEEKELRKRLDTWFILSDLLKAIVNCDYTLLEKYALILEDNLSDFSTEFSESLCQSLVFWNLVPVWRYDSLQQQQQLIETLLEHWPKKAERTRQIIRSLTQQIAPRKAFIKYLLHRPFSWKRWIVFSEIIFNLSPTPNP